MKNSIPTIICLVMFSFGLIVFTSSFPPAMANPLSGAVDLIAPAPNTPVKDLSAEQLQVLVEIQQRQQTAQLKLLIGIVGLMIAGWMGWMRWYVKGNDKKHDHHFASSARQNEALQNIALSLKETRTEHRLIQENGGCLGMECSK